MDKVELFNWAGDRKVTKTLENFGYTHGQIVEGELTNYIQTFLGEGLNVMILHGKKDVCDYVLALDTVSFYQR